jgi:acetate kinase
VAARQLEAPRSRIDAGEPAHAVGEMAPIDVVGHRIVHGGHRFTGAVLVSDEVVAELSALAELAPLHQAKSLEALHATRSALPQSPAVACFDTAFHATIPEPAATYALPRSWRERFAIRRYGFHGLSHAYASGRAAELLGRPLESLRIVTCHLGAGASLAAVQGGRSVDTTMGFTPLEGLVMSTRSGSVDPGLLLWLLERGDIDERSMAAALEHESGLLALAGTPRVEEIIDAAEAGREAAQLALDVYLHRLAAGIAAMSAAMDGLDAVVFTGGVGENSPEIRAGAARQLGFLGIALDRELNHRAGEDVDIAAPGAPVRALVIAAREDVEIARQIRALLAGDRLATEPA